MDEYEFFGMGGSQRWIAVKRAKSKYGKLRSTCGN